MIVGLWEVGVALVLRVVNLLVYMSSYGQRCSLATGARMFSVLSFVAFIAGSFAVGGHGGARVFAAAGGVAGDGV